MTVDVALIGGGLIGLSTAYRLLEATPGLSVTVLDKEPAVATHQSGRNSGVLHSGLYYRPGSLRATLCTKGKRELEAYAERRGIRIDRIGKVVVAVEDAELPRLDALLERGRANGIDGLELLGPQGLSELEPYVTGLRALHVPGTAVIDYRSVAERLAEDVRERGGRIVLGERVTGVRRAGAERVVVTPASELTARVVVGCAGLQSDRVAAAMGMRTGRRIVPFRGTYRPMVDGGEKLVRGLVYPVPDPSLPFLGVHFTPQTDGSVWIGPNAVLTLSREGRTPRTVSLRDTWSWLSYPGFWRLARRHGRPGLLELWRELSDRAFLRECRRYLPDLERHHLGPPFSGIRAQLMDRSGALLDDFALAEAPGRLQVLNAPSPAATACLAIGGVLADRVRGLLGEVPG